jgi:hypothetical protein
MRTPEYPVRLAVLSIAIVMALPGLATAATTGDVNFKPGIKMLDKNDWEPVEDQTAVGVSVSWGKETWPVHFLIDYLISLDKQEIFPGVDLQGTTAELGFGIQKTWELGRTRPFLNGGLSLVLADVDFSGSGISASESDASGGGFVGGGVFWRVGSRFNIGVSAHYSKATATFEFLDLGGLNLEDLDVEAGGLHTGLVLGWGWPGY